MNWMYWRWKWTTKLFDFHRIIDNIIQFELKWAQIKNQVATNNKTFKMVDIEKLTHEALDLVTQHDWEKCVRHAVALQDQDNEKEIIRDSMLSQSF